MDYRKLTISPIIQALAVFAFVGFVLMLLYLSLSVLLPVLFPFFLIALALPVFDWLQKRGLKRGLPLFLLIVLLLAGGIGLATTMIPPAILALTEFGWSKVTFVVIGITTIYILIENVLKPGYTGKRLSLSPMIVFLSIFFWAWLLGPVGALLSMPITVLLLLVFQHNEDSLWLAKITSRESADSLPADA